MFVELVGFWTAEHLRRKLASYHATGASAILCVDAAGACGDDEHPAEVLLFDRTVDPEDIVERLTSEWGSLCP